jgi:TolB-like protein
MKKLFFCRIFILSLLFVTLSTPTVAKMMNILVYPFENTGDKQYSWISAGMTDTAINDLIAIRQVSVISNADRRKIIEETKFILSGLVAEETMLKVGKLTGANVIFTGSYLVSDNNVRVIARLINVQTGKVENSAKLDGSLQKIFDLQDKVVLTLLADTADVNIPDVKQIRITEAEKKKIAEKPRPKTTAYELYAKGLELQDINPKEALAYYKKALDIDQTYVSALIEAGLTGTTLNLFDEALGYLNRADKTMKHNKATKTIDYANLVKNTGNVYFYKGDLDRALRYYLDSQEIIKRLSLQNTKEYAIIMMNIGLINDRKRDFDSALRHYTDSREIMYRLALQNTKDNALLMNNIGITYAKKDDLDRALSYFTHSQEIRGRLGLQNTKGYALGEASIGMVYNFKGNLDRALRYFLDSQEIQDRLGLQNTVHYAGLLFNMGILYEKRGEKRMAGTYYRKSYDTYITAGYIGTEKDRSLSNAVRLER